MQVKKFEAPSLELALAMVKREMGPHALILSTEQKKRKWYQPQSVEVTAAHEAKKAAVQEAEVDLVKIFPHRKYQVTDGYLPRKQPKNLAKYIDIETKPKVRLEKTQSHPIEEGLKKMGFEENTLREIARRLQYEFPKEDLQTPEFRNRAIGKILSENTRVMTLDQFCDAAAWIPVGLSGVGKTTVLVKLALAIRSQKRGVVLASQDERKVTGRSELASYARLIRVPFTLDSKTSRVGKVELVDTPALSFTSEEQSREILRIQSDRSALLVLDASQRLSEMLRAYELALRVHPRAVVFTKLDTISGHGAIYEFLKITHLPLLGVSLSGSFKVPFKFFENANLGQFLCVKRGEL